MASSHGLVGLLALPARSWRYGSGMVQCLGASSCMVPSTSVPGVGVGASANKGSAHKGFLQGQTRDFTAVAAVAVDAAPLRAMTGAIVTRGFAADAPAKGNPDGLALDADGVDMEHATGLEKIELEHPTVFEDDYAWIHSTEDGTPENPITVTSRFPQRIVGVTDPEDESIVLWGTIKEGEPPRQLIEGGEYFVLERIGGGDDHH
ncbi:cytochrome c oxidase subunit Vb [Pycnococcus provasolii]